MRLLGGAVMRHRTIAVEGRNGREAQRHEVGASGTRGAQLLIDRQLGNDLPAQVCVQPGEELAQGGAILLHGPANVHKIFHTLARLAQGGGVDPLDQFDARAQVFQQAAGNPRGVNQQPGS
ncbi:hypothetical protein D3C79_850790 [compost metagenome]